MKAALLATLLAACAPTGPSGFSSGEPTPEPTPESTPIPVDPPAWWGWADEPITDLTEIEALGENPGCVHPLDACADDYFAFPDRASDHARPRTVEELQEAIEGMLAGSAPLDEPTDPGLLAGALSDALNLDFLLDGLHQRPLEVRTIRITDLGDVDQLELLFVDPLVGTFRGVLRLPDGVDWRQPILGMHGHATEAADIFDSYGGAELAEAGHPVLALDLRVNYADALEDEVQRHLLLSGFSLLQIRIYEAFLGLKYLRARGDMDPAFGAIAHSGGAGAMNIAIRLNPGIAAYAFDNTADYDCWLEDDRLLDDSVPEVHPYRALINDASTASPRLFESDYGFPDAPASLLAFF
jgi:hypothetical protein